VFNQAGLSLDQAPPIAVVFRFFLIGALFGITAGFSLFFYQVSIFDATTTAAITFTHLLTLGVMLNFMFAALFQMLPVIAGVKVTSPTRKANVLLSLFTLGVITLLLGFNFPTVSLFFPLAILLLGFSIFISMFPILINLLTLKHHTSSSKGMSLSLFSLFFVLLLAFYLLLTLMGTMDGSYYLQIKTAHYSFGLFGWIALLILSISFQVIEMFYVTPAYPKRVSHDFPIVLFILLICSTLIAFIFPELWTTTHALIVILLSTYAIVTLKRLTQRKRPLTDATVWFWRLGLSSLLLSMLTLILQNFTELSLLKPLNYIFFASFALSIVFAMFYKIIPFLTWFHLNSQGYFTAPMMHEIIHPKTAKKHLYIHLATIVTFIVSLFISTFIFLAGLLMILSFSWMAYQIIHADKLYKETQKNGEKFDMGSIG
jgi:hypothetical protein